MNGVNKVILIGHLGKDPDVRNTPQGTSVANFSIATSEKWSDRNGQKHEKTEWHHIVAWNKVAELCQQYLRKGSPVYIEGKITTRQWDDQNGNKRYKTEIVANQIIFLAQNHGQNQQGASHGFEDKNYQTPQEKLDVPPPPPENDLPF